MKQGLEIVKATLKQAWLEDLMQFVERQGGATCEVMGHALELDVVCRFLSATAIALNMAFRTECKLSGGSPHARSSATSSPWPNSSSQRAALIKCTTSFWSAPSPALP